MKNIFAIFFLFYCLNLSGQNNILSATYQVIDRGIGIRYDRLFGDVGIYAAFADGNYRLVNGSVSHLKYVAGIDVKFNPGYEYNPYFSMGFAYHQFKGEEKIQNISKKVYDPISIEFGVGNHIGNVNVGIRFDILKNEAAFDLGYMF
jgi:hypothetical protein